MGTKDFAPVITVRRMALGIHALGASLPLRGSTLLIFYYERNVFVAKIKRYSCGKTMRPLKKTLGPPKET